MKVLMVCLGNICRSPIAEGVLRHISEERGIKLEIDSAGTSGYHAGEQPDARAMKCLKHHEIDISNQRCRQIKSSDFEYFDKIFAMDRSNLKDLLSMCPEEKWKSKISLFLHFEDDVHRQIVPDPYYGGEHDFERVYDLAIKGSEHFLNIQ
jgi:protein-tyrosine phosphatase